jgi:cysteine-rich repeat protein
MRLTRITCEKESNGMKAARMLTQSNRIARVVFVVTLVFTAILIYAPHHTIQAQGSGKLAYNTSLIATLSPQVPLGIYSFDGTMGDLVSVHVVSTDNTLNPTIDLVAPSQTFVTYSEDYAFGPGATDAYISVVLQETGTYSLLISGANNTYGDYLLRLTGRAPVTSVTLQYGVAVEVDIPQFPQPQYFSFEAGACLTTLLATNRVEGSPLTFPFTALVRDQDGSRIAMLQGGRAVDDAVTVMPHSGRYEIEVLSADPYTSGKIRLMIVCADDLPVCDTPADELYFPLDPPNPSAERPPTTGGGPRPDTSSEPVCGNGVLEAGEGCDPPDGTTCNDACQPIAQPVCGNGVLEAGEGCDPPDGTTCNDACQPIPYCGDGTVNTPTEQCDPPDGVTCSQECQMLPTCGNGQIEENEECDPPDGVDCDATCHRIPYCGNGIVEGAEECDPPGDGCTPNCTIVQQVAPYCGDGEVNQPSEVCDGEIGCLDNCTWIEFHYITQCGNGIIDEGETCEPPGTTGCDENCQVILY